MKEFSYTAAVASRPELLAVRRWAFVPKPKSELPGKGATEIAAETIQNLSEVDMTTKRQIAAGLKASGSSVLKQSILDVMDLSAHLKEEVARELDQQGWENLCASLLEVLQQPEAAGTEQVTKGEAAASARAPLHKCSETARGTALLRYLAYTLGFGPDHLAGAFCSSQQLKAFASLKNRFETTGILLTGDPSGEKRKKEPWNVSLCNVTYLQNRTCFGDDLCRQFTADFPEGCNLVLLGAGFDSRFYRLPLPKTAALFEVDTSPSSKTKQDCLEAHIDAISPEYTRRVHFVECDFNTESWFQALVESANMNHALPTMILLEGVSQYLPQKTFESTLELVAKQFKGPCAIAFDYFSPLLIAKLRDAMTAYNEAHVFGLEPPDMTALVTANGLHVLDHLSMETCSKRYMPYWKNSGEPLGISTDYQCFMMAGNDAMAQCCAR